MTIDELALAWRRMKRDRPDRIFIDHPFLVELIQRDINAWLETLAERLAQGFHPSQTTLCLVPKADFLLRPALVLALEDEIVYNVILGRMYDRIWQQVGGLQGDPDVAYQLTGKAESPIWIKQGIRVWKQWRTRSLKKLQPNVAYVVQTDVAGFYDNIDYNLLGQNLRRAAIDGPELNLLFECLNRWTLPRGKGVPQGYSSSDILAKVYLATFDEALRRDDYDHLRYVDDFRVFCPSRQYAKEAVKRISQLSHYHGLSLQSYKTQIIPHSRAHELFEGVEPIISAVQIQLAAEVRGRLGLTSDYLGPEELNRILTVQGGEIDPEVLERTFNDNFPATGESPFEKTLFRFLLTRLGKIRSRVALDYTVDALRQHPQETEYILRYLATIDIGEHYRERIIAYVESAEAIYDFQLYQVFGWFGEQDYDDDRLVRVALTFATDRNRPSWLRSVAIDYVGAFGRPADLDRIHEGYALADSDLERADHVGALARMELARRNGLFQRIKGDGNLVDRAIDWVKGSRS